MTTTKKPSRRGPSAYSILAFNEVELIDYLDYVLAEDMTQDTHYGVPDQGSNTVNRCHAGATANSFVEADRFLEE